MVIVRVTVGYGGECEIGYGGDSEVEYKVW